MPDVAVVTFNIPPERVETLKYSELGRIAGRNLGAYCERHGYAFSSEAPELEGRHACWGKIKSILTALDRHEWVLWADSDVLVAQPEWRLEPMLDGSADMVAQWPLEWFDLLRLDHARGWRTQPVNTGVFITRRSAWSVNLLRNAWLRSRPATRGQRWNGVGDQEAIAAELRTGGLIGHISYVPTLQRPPQRGDLSALFVHLYGNHASYRYSPEICQAVVAALESRVSGRVPATEYLPLLHWCSIQNLDPICPLDRGPPERFNYEGALLDQLMATLTLEGGV